MYKVYQIPKKQKEFLKIQKFENSLKCFLYKQTNEQFSPFELQRPKLQLCLNF